jgi:hypothetical protein
MTDTFDPLEAYAILRAQARERRGPKMTSANKMHAFALLHSGVPHEVVGKMFGISGASISHLANCLKRDPGKTWRYSDVFIEWRRLGEEKFMASYLTEENFLKAQRFKYGVDDNATDDHTQLHLTSNPRADSCSHALIGSVDLGEWRARIDFVPCDHPDIPADKRGPDGWRYATVDANDYPTDAYVSIAPYDEPQRADGLWMPWRTSADCCNHLHRMMGLKNPRRGRPRRHQS